MIRLKEILRRVEHLEWLLSEEYFPQKCDMCCSCENGVLCITSRGHAHYRCIKDIQEKCKDFKPVKSPEQT